MVHEANQPDLLKPLADEDGVIEHIAEALLARGFSHSVNTLPLALCNALRAEILNSDQDQFTEAGVGRHLDHLTDREVRRDSIKWIQGDTEPQRVWLAFCERLKVALNRRLMLGLFSFESHFAHYAPGAFYRRHLDAFRGQANRVLSVVAYLNEQWDVENGGQLVLYESEECDQALAEIQPFGGSLVVFLSEEFPHEVLPALKDRYSIAGWFRVNTSSSTRVDPPN